MLKYNITEIRAFYDVVQMKQLSQGQINLWHALMYLNDKCACIEWFSVPNIVLELNTGLSRNGIAKARNTLKQHGLIDFKANGTNATLYKMNTIAKSVQDSVQSSGTLNKLNKYYLKKKKIIKEKENLISPKGDSSSDDDGVSFSNSANAVSPVGDIPSKEKSMLEIAESSNVEQDINTSLSVTKKKNKKEKQSADEEALSYNFEIIWKSYPRKDGKMEAYRHYKSLIKGKKVLGTTMKFSNDEILDAVLEYAREKEYTDKQYLAQGSTFFNNKIIDYLLKERENSE